MARVEVQRGQHQQGAERAREALSYVERVGSKWSRAQVASVIGDAERYMGNLEAAEAAHRLSAELLASIGTFDAVYGQANLALCQMERGHWQTAHETLATAIVSAQSCGSRKVGLIVNCIALLTDAKLERWVDWDKRVAFLQPMLDSSFADLDIAECALKAARHGDALGQQSRTDFAWTLAIRQFRLLDFEERAEAVRQEWTGNRYGR